MIALHSPCRVRPVHDAPPCWVRVVMPRRVPMLVGGTRSAHPRLVAGTTVALLCLAWGCIIGLAAGATAGTMIVPLLGTIYGGLVGAPVGAIVGAVWAAGTVIALTARHGDVGAPHAPMLDVARLLGVLVLLIGVILVVVVVAFLFGDAPVLAIWAAAVAAATMVVVVRLLRVAVLAISQAWCAPFGWQRAERAVSASRRA